MADREALAGQVVVRMVRMVHSEDQVFQESGCIHRKERRVLEQEVERRIHTVGVVEEEGKRSDLDLRPDLHEEEQWVRVE